MLVAFASGAFMRIPKRIENGLGWGDGRGSRLKPVVAFVGVAKKSRRRTNVMTQKGAILIGDQM